MTTHPPYVAHSDTSRAAAASIAPDTNRLRAIVLESISAWAGGMTCDEVEQFAQLSHQTASARIRELVLRGQIEPLTIDGNPVRRPTRSGRMATVYVTKEAAR